MGMANKSRKTRSSRRTTWSTRFVEPLEARQLLACDVIVEDANHDCQVDEADFIQALQAGRFDNGQAATAEQGDWNGDGLFDSADLVAMFVRGKYRKGPYGESETGAIDQLHEIDNSATANVTVYYMPDSGDLFVTSDSFLSAFHVRSQSQQFLSNSAARPFNVGDESDLFQLTVEGRKTFQFLGALPTGLTTEALQNDLLVSGARYAGGDLGGVRWGLASELPAGLPFTGDPPGGRGDEGVPNPPPPPTTEGIGDANNDGYVDEADLIQAMKHGLFNTAAEADATSGDWNGDGVFDSQDIADVFKSGSYRDGGYREDAGEPVNQLQSLRTATADADVTVHYDDQNGDVIVISHSGPISTIHLSSPDASFARTTPLEVASPFDVLDQSDVFLFHREDTVSFRIAGLFMPGIAATNPLEGILVDGAMVEGGGLGTVAIGTADQLGTGPIDVLNLSNDAESSFVAVGDATVVFAYDAATGDVVINSTNGTAIGSIEIKSETSGMIGSINHQYSTGSFDHDSTDTVFRLDEGGFSTWELPGLLEPGLSHAYLANDLSVLGNHVDASEIHVSLNAAIPAVGAGCGVGLRAGDINGDGRFSSEDLVLAFQAGGYEDDSAGNSNWSAGDWNCDGDFDSADLVFALSEGFDEAVAAVAAAIEADRA